MIRILPNTDILLDSLHNGRVSDGLADGTKWTTKDFSKYFQSFMKIRLEEV